MTGTHRPTGNPGPGPLVRGCATINELFEETVSKFGDVEAIVDGDHRLSYGTWWEHAGGLASRLRELGLRRGDVVVSLLPTSSDYAILYVAAVRLGAVMTGLNPRLGSDEVAAIFAQVRPAVVVSDDEGARLVPAGYRGARIARTELPSLYDLPAPPSPSVQSTDPVAIVWTSGTTGLPKGAWFDHKALEGSALCAGELTVPYDRRLVPVPFMHAGFMTKLWDLAACANTVVMSSTPWNAAAMLEQTVSERITVAVAVPTQWTKLLQLPDIATADFSSLRIAVTSTAPAPPDLVEAIQARLGCDVLVRYATTETAVGTGTRIGDPPDVVFETVGRPQHGVDLRLVDDDGNPVDDGREGKVELRTIAQSRGYWADADATSASLTPDGWFRTGDLGRIRPDGNLVLCGRSTDMYIRGGYNVYPLEVENVLGQHPDVAEVAVLGVTAPVIGEQGVAVVVPRSLPSPPSLEELRRFATERIADYKAPDRLVITESLPRNPMGKVHRPELRALVAEALDDSVSAT